MGQVQTRSCRAFVNAKRRYHGWPYNSRVESSERRDLSDENRHYHSTLTPERQGYLRTPVFQNARGVILRILVQSVPVEDPEDNYVNFANSVYLQPGMCKTVPVSSTKLNKQHVGSPKSLMSTANNGRTRNLHERRVKDACTTL